MKKRKKKCKRKEDLYMRSSYSAKERMEIRKELLNREDNLYKRIADDAKERMEKCREDPYPYLLSAIEYQTAIIHELRAEVYELKKGQHSHP